MNSRLSNSFLLFGQFHFPICTAYWKMKLLVTAESNQKSIDYFRSFPSSILAVGHAPKKKTLSKKGERQLGTAYTFLKNPQIKHKGNSSIIFVFYCNCHVFTSLYMHYFYLPSDFKSSLYS